MPRMPKYRKEEWSFFLDDRGRIAYNKLCRRCDRSCKQSFRSTVILCPEYHSKRSIANQREKTDSLIVQQFTELRAKENAARECKKEKQQTVTLDAKDYKIKRACR